MLQIQYKNIIKVIGLIMQLGLISSEQLGIKN